MKAFIHENFLLQNKSAERLYHEYAKELPIIDYHCHLIPEEIATDKQYANMSQAWLYGDHYKWRAMRSMGVDEKYCTGNATDEEKFMKWAETIPNTLKNPLYHWSHMELKRYFGIDELLNPGTAKDIYARCNEKLNSPEYTCRGLIKMMNVETICTTDDPVDDLRHHDAIAQSGFGVNVAPAWRPDKAMAIENAESYRAYIQKLGEAAGMEISTFDQFLEALEKRHAFFHEKGCRLSDHGIETAYAEDYTESQLKATFAKVMDGGSADHQDVLAFKSAMLVIFGEMDHKRGWVQQFHLGAMRNNSTRMFDKLGPDTGFDSIGDFEVARPLSRMLDRLDRQGKLAKTILYNLNPRDNELMVSMIGNFNNGGPAGKMQYGSGWWFLDQKDGMERQIASLSSLGLLSQFVGMLTDSRSFLSYPRHEYFRRILCNILGRDMERGEVPMDFDLVGQMVQNISYYNAKRYFDF
jgi:glucuronate isomerase